MNLWTLSIFIFDVILRLWSLLPRNDKSLAYDWCIVLTVWDNPSFLKSDTWGYTVGVWECDLSLLAIILQGFLYGESDLIRNNQGCWGNLQPCNWAPVLVKVLNDENANGICPILDVMKHYQLGCCKDILYILIGALV